MEKTYTFADYLTWNDGQRYELIKGKLFKMSPAPLERHQSVLGDLFFWLKSLFIQQKKTCKIYVAPFDIRLPHSPQDADNQVKTVVQPDLVVICDTSKIDKRGCNGAPDLIVEIISPATAKKDLNEKFNLYQEAGVKEYWVVFPEESEIIVFVRNKNGLYDEGTLYNTENNKIITSKTIQGLEIDITLIF